MKRTSIAVSVLLLAGVIAIAPSNAADLGYDDGYERDKYGYNDPGYDDEDRYAYRERPRYEGGEYDNGGDDEFYEGDDHRRSLKDDPYDDAGSKRIARNDGEQSTCLSRKQVVDRLDQEGWRRLDILPSRPDIVRLRAERDNGLVYRLRLDGCSGTILTARLINPEDIGRRKTAYKRIRSID